MMENSKFVIWKTKVACLAFFRYFCKRNSVFEKRDREREGHIQKRRRKLVKNVLMMSRHAIIFRLASAQSLTKSILPFIAKKSTHHSSHLNNYFKIQVCVSFCPYVRASIRLQCFITLMGPEALSRGVGA